MMLRVTIGLALVIYGMLQQGPENNHIGNAAWFFVILLGLYMLAPMISFLTKTFLKGKEEPSVKNKMDTVRAFYIGSVAIFLIALDCQIQLNRKGYIYVGRGYDYAISGVTAQWQVKACWFGAITSILIAVILHIKAKLFVSSFVQIDNMLEIPQYVICPKCVEPLCGKDNQSMTCSTCQITLEDLKGFYDRHPALQSDNKDASAKENGA